MHYDLTDLRVFLAVVDEGNLSRGASRCNLAPSSVSLRIKNLEEMFGTPLLHRQTRGVGPTAAGRVLTEHARRCLAQLEQMHADLLPYSQGLTGHVTVFANNNAISSFLPQDLPRFFKAYPTVRITLEERMSHEIVQAIAEGRADAGIVAFDADHPELEFFPYRQDELILLAPKEMDFGDRDTVSFGDCLRHPFICLQQGAAMHTFLVNHAAALGVKLDVRVQVSGYRAIANLVASGAGVGIVPRSALEDSDSSAMHILGLSEPWSIRNLRICVKRRAEAENAFRERLVAVLRGDRELTRSP
jgi:DNA-binding transcriptional LysR family regulator